jgi:hypothetical protein
VLFDTAPKFLEATAAAIFFRATSLLPVPAFGMSFSANLGIGACIGDF